MLGYNTMRQVLVWVELEEPGEATFVYWNNGDTVKIKATAIEESSNTIKFITELLDPGTTYNYQIIVPRENYSSTTYQFTTQSNWQHRTDPPSFKIALGSCAYLNEAQFDRPGEPYGRNYGIFNQIVKQEPELMLWLGDNFYLRDADLYAKATTFYRYSTDRATKELQPLLAAAHHYAIWDDHDFGPNDADGSYIGKENSLAAFKSYWGNPFFGINGQPGITSAFEYNDVDFFLLDNRYHRNANLRTTGEKAMLGKPQIEWLIDALKYSSAPFKLVAVGGQVLNTAAVYENYATFPEEREFLLKRIEEEAIKGVVFVTGDRHKTELSYLQMNDSTAVYDLTVSPLTAKFYNTIDEPNSLRVDGTHTATNNFAILEFTGSLEKRKMEISIYNHEGKLQWSKQINRF
jgi:alkaline phosphatase D